MAARSADAVPTDVLHHVPPAANSATAFANVNVNSLEGLHSLPLLNLRKPLLGYRSPSAPIEDLLAGSAAASSTPTPSLQQSKLASFFKKPPAEPAVPAADAAEEAPPAPADEAAEEAPVEQQEADAPSWAASGGMLLAVMEEMVQSTLTRNTALLTADEHAHLRLLLPTSNTTALSVSARALYARLFARRGIAFRLSALSSYAEVGDDPTSAAIELQTAGLCRLVSPSTSLDGPLDGMAASLVLELLTSPQLKQLAVAAGLPPRAPLAARSNAAAAASADASDPSGTVADIRRQLRGRLGLPTPPSRLRPPTTAATAATATTNWDRGSCRGAVT